jgi:hypothetical protein
MPLVGFKCLPDMPNGHTTATGPGLLLGLVFFHTHLHECSAEGINAWSIKRESGITPTTMPVDYYNAVA